MSWSVTAVGKPAAVKVALAVQFERAIESTKSIPHEQESVKLVQQVVNGQLDFLSQFAGKAVKVEANGSAWTSPAPDGGTNIRVDVQQLGGFVE